MAAVLEPLPDLASVLEQERDELCWMTHSAGEAFGHPCFPRRRLYGEIGRALQPYFELAAQPVELQVDPDNPLWARIAEVRDWPAFGPLIALNLPRWAAQKLVWCP